ncbi:hypothetical protein KC343_g9885 [Hortaea werneckii]|uniref:BZIP domain-containing protein n=1 Tax=Hortaea werneckii TaxID=91943 RepID=A0A3M7CJP1_HORWE|nr:hypothetical protein KC317_g14111 [Hortaea werneckii]KAI7608142.1 hypothetical protein KC346_g9734 [Hortaea werneckii]KAI7616051.1 hypothetical protein KC343_g9885 [Hortaea werneckii]RMY52328.1 hypothetical protein D0864_14279 [Hortaea werneckii]
MTSRPTVKTEPFDMDSFFDFSQGGGAQPSPATASSSKIDALSPFDKGEERQQFNGPSHDYSQYKQQVGLPVGSMANMPMSQPQMFDGYNSGIGDMAFDGGFGAGWSSGIDMDSEMDFANPQSSMPPMFFPPQNEGDNFVNPNTIGGHEEPTSNVGRLWPGMHSQQAQQAAMQKAAQNQAMQQRQMKLQAQHAQYRQLANQSQAPQQQSQNMSKRPSNVSEPHVEESISRLLNQMRQQSTASMDDDGSPGGLLPQIARMKKDEEEMDEDERLLASDEGKKLSSKERRQLRNKVSARAFRSRRKEYISQLEGEVALKTQEASTLRQENGALLQENDRYRGLIETLLRHPAFTPFINDISKDPATLISQAQQMAPPQQTQVHQAPTPAQPAPQPQQHAPQQEQKPDFMNFDASQLQIPSQQPAQEQQSQQVSMAMIPEENFSKLNLGNYQPSMNFNQFNTVNAYAVTDVPAPDPVNLLATSSSAHLSASSSAPVYDFDFATDMTTTASPSPRNLDVLLAKLDGAASRMSPL